MTTILIDDSSYEGQAFVELLKKMRKRYEQWL